MSGNIFGNIFRLTTFGESHGPAIGGIIDGCPAGLTIDPDQIRNDLARRRPGQSELTTDRKEEDNVEILSGIFENVTLGTPIGFLIRNTDARPVDYDKMKDVFRPSHADFTYNAKYGRRDYRGGGRSSARETLSRVFAGSVAKQLITAICGAEVKAYVSAVGNISTDKSFSIKELLALKENDIRCPDEKVAEKMMQLIKQLKENGDSTGGVITCVVSGIPAGLGEPVFDKLHADLGKAMLSINAVHGFEYGSGFAGTKMKGSKHNDAFVSSEGKTGTLTNHSGGIQGGISNGSDIYFRVAFKPVATIKHEQETINTSGENVKLSANGRHDPVVVPRAVPIVEAMTAIVLADHLLRQRSAVI